MNLAISGRQALLLMVAVLVAVAASFMPEMAFAQLAEAPPPDYAAATAYINDNGAPAIVAVGAVLFTLAAVALIVKWVKAAFFG